MPQFMTVHQGRIDVGFDPVNERAGPIQWAMELALAGWQGRCKYLSEDSAELETLLDEKYGNPLLGVVAAHSLWLAARPNRDLLATIQRHLERLAPDHPDIAVLGALARQRDLPGLGDRPAEAQLRWPPMFTASYRTAVRLDWDEVSLLARGSPAAFYAAALLASSVWSLWDDVSAHQPEDEGGNETGFGEAEKAGEEDKRAILGTWLTGALQMVPALRDLIATLGWGPHIDSSRDLWTLLSGSDSRCVRLLLSNAERLFNFAASRKRLEELRTLSLPDLGRSLNLPRSEINREVTLCLHPKPALPAEPVSDWPPPDGRHFVKSEEFGRLLLQEVEPLLRRYPDLDFTDAAAHIFIWMDGKLRKNRRFLNRERFRTEDAFRAYLRTAAMNAARRAHRRRKLQQPLSDVSAETDLALDPVEIAALRESLEALDDPYRTVLQQLFFERANLRMVAYRLGLATKQVERLYAEALDRLRLE